MGQQQAKNAEPEVVNEATLKQDRTRGQVVEEIEKTERTYVTSLEIMIDLFLTPLQKAVEAKKPIIKEQHIKTIFFSLTEIYKIQHDFLQEIEKKRRSWVEKSSTLGDVFINHADLFKSYTAYVNNYNVALTLLTRLTEESKKFNEFLAEVHHDPRCKHLDLSGYLIMPIQRLPRYVLLLNELLKHTRPTHPDHPLCTKALGKVKEISDFINEEKGHAEAVQALLELQSSFTDDISLLAAKRVLVSEGDFQLLFSKKDSSKTRTEKLKNPPKHSDFKFPKRGSVIRSPRSASAETENEIHFFLFTDMLLVAKPTSKNNFLKGTPFKNKSKDYWKVGDYGHLLDVEIQALPIPELENLLHVVVGDSQYVVQLGSKEEVQGYTAKFYTVRASSSQIGFVDIFRKQKGKPDKLSKSKSFFRSSSKPDESPKADTEPLVKQPEPENKEKSKGKGLLKSVGSRIGKSATPDQDSSKQDTPKKSTPQSNKKETPKSSPQPKQSEQETPKKSTPAKKTPNKKEEKTPLVVKEPEEKTCSICSVS